MSNIVEALRGARHPGQRPRAARTHQALLAGAGGPLGSAVLERALGAGVFARVRVLVTQDFSSSHRGFEAVALPDLQAPAPALGCDTALVVFDRERASNGREAAYWRPEPPQLPALAAWLRAGGVQRLVVVLPHAPGLLPQALKQGLASLDEQAVAAAGFEQLVFVRSARQAGAAASADALLQRLALSMLKQLHWLVPQRDQPVRADTVARFAVEVAAQLDVAPAATRVAPPELLWQFAQQPRAGAALVRAWLQGEPLAEAPVPRQRL